jgi:hypothetical protein
MCEPKGCIDGPILQTTVFTCQHADHVDRVHISLELVIGQGRDMYPQVRLKVRNKRTV